MYIVSMIVVMSVAASASDVPDLKTASEQNVKVKKLGEADDLPVIDKKASEKGCTAVTFGLNLQPVPILLEIHLPHLLARGQGLVVASVIPDSAAWKAGLKEDDIVSGLNDRALFSQEQLDALLGKTKTGGEVILHVIRRGTLYKTATMLDIPEATPAKVRQGCDEAVIRPQHATVTSIVCRRDGATIAISSTDDRTFKVDVKLAGESEQRFTGDKPSLLRQIEGLPEMVRMEIERLLTAEESSRRIDVSRSRRLKEQGGEP